MAARNEAGYIAVALRSLIEEGIEVALIDNGSIDGTREIAEQFLGGGLTSIVDLPWRGSFDLKASLEAKHDIYDRSPHDWHIHVDADEWLRARNEVSVSELLGRFVDARFVVVNFREYCFLPPVDVDMWGRDYRALATSYYLFEPRARRLMRAWRRGKVGSNIEDGGHHVSGVADGAIYPEDQTMRHYIGLSWSHAILKRADRAYAPDDLARGWHWNRLDMRAARPVAAGRLIKHAVPWDTRNLDDSAPSQFRFWQADFNADNELTLDDSSAQ
jgi:glycosyltransferase involved in cell wall biosynthesis